MTWEGIQTKLVVAHTKFSLNAPARIARLHESRLLVAVDSIVFCPCIYIAVFSLRHSDELRREVLLRLILSLQEGEVARAFFGVAMGSPCCVVTYVEAKQHEAAAEAKGAERQPQPAPPTAEASDCNARGSAAMSRRSWLQAHENLLCTDADAGARSAR